MRWIKQRKKYDCVPVMFLNVLKWLGHKVSYERDYLKWAKRTRTRPSGAGNWKDVFNTLKVTNKETDYYPTVRRIRKKIREGAIVVLRSGWRSGGDIQFHVLLVTNESSGRLFCVNRWNGHNWLDDKEFKYLYLEKHETEDYLIPVVWYIWK